jgi:tetratricopeptide (TPR) repeat protein
VEQTVEMDVSCVPSQNVVESEKVSRLWAMQKIADLDMDYDANRDEIMRLAKKYTIVTKDTSLIVLDSVQDYVRYGIEPPEDLKDEYDRIVSRQTTSKPVNDGIPQEVYTKFEEFKRWWNKKPEDFKKANSKEKGADGIGRPRTSSNELRVAGSGFSESVPNASTSTASSRASEAIADFEWEEDEAEYEPMMADAAPMDYVEELYLGEAKGTSEAKGGSSSTSPTVTLQTWSSKSDYISILKKTPKKQMYEKYLELKKSYGASPAFFMEVSDYFVEENLLDDGLRILSNLAEMNLENTDVLRALGNKLVEHGQYAVAIRVFRNLTKLREGIPQFYRDLAMAYEKNGEYQNAVDALWHIASNKWDSRYSEIQQTALNDMNSIIARCAKKSNVRLDTSAIDRKLMENFDVDLRVVLTWNTDDCDIDLWVTDPNGEKCFYGHKETAVGGRMSRDFTQGYGPEEFCLKVAPGGKYKIECNYYGSHQQKLLQPVIVQAEVYTNFGRPNQEKQVMTLQLDDVKQTFLIGDVNVR